MILFSVFFNYPPTPEVFAHSLHVSLPFVPRFRPTQPARHLPDLPRLERAPPSPRRQARHGSLPARLRAGLDRADQGQDRKSTRLNSSHANISYAVFCLKKI